MFSAAFSELLVEFIGTFLVTLPAPLCTYYVGPLAAIPVGFMTASMAYSFLFISGAHFSPTISFAMFISQRMSLKRMIMYIITQVLAAFASCMYAAYPIGVDIAAPLTASSLGHAWRAFTIETALTMAIVTVYMHNCCSRQRSNQYYGFAIGFTFLAAIMCIPDGFSGSAFNPAIATALQLTRCIAHGECIALSMTWLHWVAPCIGTFAGVFMYGILDTEEKVVPVEAAPPAAFY